ncbi:HNH endonuclease signature motif containing protein [Methylocella sp.]|jgi:hypothetical protein|uniref:HNH endonuclease signature motif containing protein n=1 Tax=Methylocella sp. TaxID=1978226 RepID=UPI003C1F3654
MATEQLTAERLRELLDYDQATGAFTWRATGHGRLPGQRAGSPSSDGTMVISIDRIRQKAHNLAVLYVTGEWPKRVVRYLDGNRRNCAWDNLREAPGPKPTNKARGGRGVYCARGGWRVEIVDEYGVYRGGPFTKQSAATADHDATARFRAEFFSDPVAALKNYREKAQRRAEQLRSTASRTPGIPASEIEPRNARSAAMMKLYEPIKLRERLYAARRDLEAQHFECRQRLAFASLEKVEAKLKWVERALAEVERREFNERYFPLDGAFRDDLLDFDFYGDTPRSDVREEADIAADVISGGGFSFYSINDK